MVRDTSIDSYYDPHNKVILSRCQQIVYDAYKLHPNSTDREIRKYTNLEINNITGRRNELVDMELIVDNGKRKCEISGRTVYVWKPKTKTEIKKLTINFV